jgi:hypothetical protein
MISINFRKRWVMRDFTEVGIVNNNNVKLFLRATISKRFDCF